MLKKTKLYKKIRDYVCEYLGINYHFFHRRALLKLDYKIGISKKKTKLSHKFYKNILAVFTQKDEINQDSSWLKIFNNFHKNIIEIIQKDNSKIEDILGSIPQATYKAAVESVFFDSSLELYEAVIACKSTTQ